MNRTLGLRIFSLSLFLGGVSLFFPPPTRADDRSTLELHAHLFMKEGMGWAFRGDFNGPLRATDWTQRFSSQANPETLDRSELGIVVATLYAHPLFTLSLRNSVRRQVALAERFVAEHPQWIIAHHAHEARAALDRGKKVMILALEGASGIIENEQDLHEFIDEKGIRLVNLLHLSDDEFGGAAYMTGTKYFSALGAPWAWLKQVFTPAHDSQGVHVNAYGLTEEGRTMAAALIQRHVWLDLSHAGDRSQAELVPMMEKAGQPLLYTHSVLRKYSGAERGISADQLAAVRKTGGVFGLMPSDDMLAGTTLPPSSPVQCPEGCTASCAGGIMALAEQYAELATVLDPRQIALGSDYNGGVHHLPPPPCPLGTALDKQGLWNIGQQAQVWDALAQLGLPVPTPRRQMIDHFLEAWAKVDP